MVGFVGRLVRDKGIVELYEAFRALVQVFPDARLLLVGTFEAGDPVPRATRDWLIQDGRVIHVGWQAQVRPYYYLMDVLVFPSYREGLSQVLLQAQASGVPVVATRANRVRVLGRGRICAAGAGRK